MRTDLWEVLLLKLFAYMTNNIYIMLNYKYNCGRPLHAMDDGGDLFTKLFLKILKWLSCS